MQLSRSFANKIKAQRCILLLSDCFFIYDIGNLKQRLSSSFDSAKNFQLSNDNRVLTVIFNIGRRAWIPFRKIVS